MSILNFNNQNPLVQLKKHKLYHLPINIIEFTKSLDISVGIKELKTPFRPSKICNNIFSKQLFNGKNKTFNLLVPQKLLKKEISKMDILDYDILEDIFKVPDTVLRQKVLKYRS